METIKRQTRWCMAGWP